MQDYFSFEKDLPTPWADEISNMYIETMTKKKSMIFIVVAFKTVLVTRIKTKSLIISFGLPERAHIRAFNMLS